MHKTVLSVLLLFCCAFAQTAPPTPPHGLKVSGANPAPSQKPAEPSAAAEIPSTEPVITLAGFCPDAPAGTDPKSPDCKTVITKGQFEKLVDTLNPKMPPQARQNIAGDYSKMLVFSNEAKKRGLEDTQRFKDLLKFVSMQVASQELIRNMQEQAKPSDAEMQKYYQENASKYEEISLKRIFIPRNSPSAKPDDKKPTDEELKAEGEKAKAKIAAGEDFDKLQKEIYAAKGYNTPPPPTSIPNWRRDSVPPSQKDLFNLKDGELSAVMVEPAGAYVYKIDKKQTIPFESVKAEIESQLTNQKMRAEMEALTNSIKPELNQAYFRAFAPTPSEGIVGPAVTPKPAPSATVAPATGTPKSPAPKANATKPPSSK